MTDQTKIEWADSTFNPWIGCTKVSPACDHCYAERQMGGRLKRVQWGAGQPRHRTSAANWKLPLKRWNERRFMECGVCGWRGECEAELIGCGACGSIEQMNDRRRRVFSASLADWLDNEVPIEWLVDLLDLIRCTPNLDWLLLTKRIGNWQNRIDAAEEHAFVYHEDGDALHEWISDWGEGRSAPKNVWIGATVVNQGEVNRDVPKLLAVPARVRFLSIEPMLDTIKVRLRHTMLGPVDGGAEFRCPTCDNGSVPAWGGYPGAQSCPDCMGEPDLGRLHWIICGGESGPHARPMHPDWVRSLRDQCAHAGVPFLFKQWGEWAPNCLCSTKYAHPELKRPEPGKPGVMFRCGKAAAGRQLDGVTHDGFPESAA